MAKRVSGRVSVRLTYLDEDDCYKCRVSNLDGEGSPIKVYVNPPKCSQLSVDSSQAYDDAARAAIAFAGVQEYAMYENVGGTFEMVLERKR